MSNVRETVDWTPFENLAKYTVTCVCGHTYRSHAQFITLDKMRHGAEGTALIAREACKMCGGERMTGAASDTEQVTLR